MCDVFVGGRMHANIAALSQETPTVAVSYSHKFRGIMSELGQSAYVTELLDPAIVMGLVVRALHESEQIRTGLSVRLPGLYERVRRDAFELRELVKMPATHNQAWRAVNLRG